MTSRYGTAVAAAWDRVHPRLTHRSAWLDHDGPLPVIEGTLIRLQVDHLPGDRDPKPVWLWSSATGVAPDEVDRLWQAFLRRFDLEHTFRLFKQVLGWTAPKIRNPPAADRWTWLIITVHAQLRLARPLASDLRRPWERPAPPGQLTPARVRRGFRNIRPTIPCPAAHQNPASPALAGRQARRTAIRTFLALSQPRLALGTVSVARTDCESMTAAVGWGWRPAAALTWARSCPCSRARVPSSRQAAK